MNRNQVSKFVVHPKTGIQIYRGFPTPHWLRDSADQILKDARRMAAKTADADIVELVRENIACRPVSRPETGSEPTSTQSAEVTDWIPCGLPQPIFFRLRKVASELLLDLLIDTQQGAGRQEKNHIEVVVKRPMGARAWSTLKSAWTNNGQDHHYHLADFYISDEPVNVDGTLTMDFGNCASTFIFRKTGQGPAEIEPLELNNPWDLFYFDRSIEQLKMIRSNILVLRAGLEREQPWFILGERADEMVQNYPQATFIYAPKKFVRNWPEDKQFRQPRTFFRDVKGSQRAQHYEKQRFVKHGIEQLLQMVLSSLCNPKCETSAPQMYPQINRIAVTYPLTWRECDREVFKKTVESTAHDLLDLEPDVRKAFKVELVCSEPVAVAAFAVWETFYQFDTHLQLATSTLGNFRGTQDLTVLVVDIGGGSTDVACVEIQWMRAEDTQRVDVSFKLIESMRFNRAGDRLSHILATVIREYLAEKYGFEASLAFEGGEDDPVFTRSYRRQAVSKIYELTEEAKKAISANPLKAWELDREDELLQPFEPLLRAGGTKKGDQRLVITHDMLRRWAQMDVQSRLTNHEPGFMDVFTYISELSESLKAEGRTPDLVVLSGRTTRLPFIREMVAQHVALPLHRVRRLEDIIPATFVGQRNVNIDKFSVVCGAHYFRSGDQIRFISCPSAQIFNRFIGTVKTTPAGLKLLHVLIEARDSAPRTITVRVPGSSDVRIGHAFRRDGNVQIMANLSNASPDDLDVELDV